MEMQTNNLHKRSQLMTEERDGGVTDERDVDGGSAKRRFHSNRVTKADIASGKAVCRGGKWFVDEIEVTT